MNVTYDDLGRLLELQNIDLNIMRQTKRLNELPQRRIIAEARQKKAAIVDQHSKVSDLRKKIEKKISRINDEDASLMKKQQGVQAAMDAAQGDFRNVEARSKELNGIVKRRETLDQELEHLGEELDRISGLEDQISSALDNMASKEDKAVRSYQEESGTLKETISRHQSQRDTIVNDLPDDLVSLYDKTAKRCGGVAVGRLDGIRCGSCRSVIDSGRLIDLKAHAPLGTCPSCKRLLIVG